MVWPCKVMHGGGGEVKPVCRFATRIMAAGDVTPAACAPVARMVVVVVTSVMPSIELQ